MNLAGVEQSNAIVTVTPKDQRLIRTALQELQADPWTARLAPLQHLFHTYHLGEIDVPLLGR